MNPGDLDQRLYFMMEGGVDDEGYPIPNPTEYAKAWGELKTLKGSTYYAAAQNNMEHNRDFSIRFQSKLLDENRPKNLYVVWRKQKHEIESIEDVDGQRVSMLVRCRAVT